MNEIYAYQFIILFVAGILILRSFIKFLQNKKTIREFILSCIIWSAFAAVALFANFTTTIARLVGFELGINFILTITTVILFTAVVMLIVKSDKTASDLTKLTRELALKDLKKN